jgi:hypothetical protein
VGASGVAGHIDAGTCRPPHRRALDHLDGDADARKHRRQRQTRDTATHDQHAPPIHGFKAPPRAISHLPTPGETPTTSRTATDDHGLVLL